MYRGIKMKLYKVYYRKSCGGSLTRSCIVRFNSKDEVLKWFKEENEDFRRTGIPYDLVVKRIVEVKSEIL